MARIHPLACVDPAARIADDAEIGPFCVIGPQVTVDAGCRLLAHVHVAGRTRIGARTTVHPYASLGAPPQSTRYRGEPTELVIGADCDIREGVTMSVGTAHGGGVTRVGAGGFFMANAHVAHDCQVGEKVVFANSATLGGHCVVGDRVFIGGLAAVHQFCRVGAHAMVGGMAGASRDVIPFGMVRGSTARLIGLNLVGMKRCGIPRESIRAARAAYRAMFFGEGVFAERVQQVAARYAADPVVAAIVDFVRGPSHRSLCHPRTAEPAPAPDAA